MELFWYDIRQMTDSDYADALTQMPSARKKLLDNLPTQDDRKRAVAAEALACRVLAEKSGVLPGAVSLCFEENGRLHTADSSFYAATSSSGAWAVCAVDHHPLGVDVEVIRNTQEKFIQRVCSPQELSYIRYGDADCLSRFWECWTAKEAVFQLTGKGPLLTLSQFSLPDHILLDHILCHGCAVTAASSL